MSRAYHSASSAKLGERCPRAWGFMLECSSVELTLRAYTLRVQSMRDALKTKGKK